MKSLCSKGNFVVPGERLRPQCRHKLESSEKPAEEDTEISDIEDVFGEDLLVESIRSLLNSTICDHEVSPLKVHSVKSSSKPSSQTEGNNFKFLHWSQDHGLFEK